MDNCVNTDCNIFNIGCIPSCGLVVISNITINDAGQYTIVYDINSVRTRLSFTVAEGGDALRIDAGKLPVNREIIFSIINTDEDQVVITIDDIEYTHFRLIALIGDTGLATESDYSNLIWQELIAGDGSDHYAPAKPVYSYDLLQVFRDGILCRLDANLAEVNTYKIVSGVIYLDGPLQTGEFLHITKLKQ